MLVPSGLPCANDDATFTTSHHLVAEAGTTTLHSETKTFTCLGPEYSGAVTATCNLGTFDPPTTACKSKYSLELFCVDFMCRVCPSL